MDRFRRNSKSSVKSLDSPKKSSPPSQPPRSKEWPEQEQEMFGLFENREKLEENDDEPATVNKFIENAKLQSGTPVDPAEEAYKTPSKPGKESKIPKPARPSDVKTSEMEKTEDDRPQNGPDEGDSSDVKPEDSPPKTGISDGEEDENEGADASEKKEKAAEDTTVGLLPNIIISCVAYILAVILVAYYLLKDLIPAKVSTLRQAWQRFTAPFIATPGYVNKWYKDVFAALIKKAEGHEITMKSPPKKPQIIVTPASGN